MKENKEPEAAGQMERAAAADYEYSTLMRLLGVSVSKHLLDEHFTLIWANEFYYQLIGWPKEEYEATFHNRPDLYYQNDPEEWKQLSDAVLNAFKKHQPGYRLVSRFRKKTGELIWVQFATQFADEYVDGYQVAYSVLTDVDDLVQMQKEKTVTYESLPGFVAKYQIDSSLNMTLLDANGRYQEYFGRASTQDDNSLYKQNIEDNRKVIEEQREKIQQGKPLHFVMHVKDRQGEKLWLQVSASCVDRQNDCSVYLVIFIDITDITELREMQRKLTQQKEELEDALDAAERAHRAKSDFLSRMSHDIRTPMNAVLGMNRIIAAHIHDPERILDCVGKIDTASKLLLSLINEVLDMSKIESGRIVLAEEEVNLAELVQDVVTMVQPQIQSKKQVFKTYVNSLSHETVVSDLQRLQQILLNLLSNAVKYTPEGGSVIMEIGEKPGERPDTARYEFVVSDTGIGMKPEFLSRIFDPFERADDAEIQSVQGTGLGLSICKSIAEQMGGTVQVESVYGQGSRFTVTICLRVQEEPMDENALAGLRVLVVDDDESVCRGTCERLWELGVTAEWVTDGCTALDKVERARAAGQDYFAVILDCRMPGMDGVETTRLIRERVGDNLPIIMISAYDLSEKMDEAKEAGANGFITKPLFRSRLVYKLKQFAQGGFNTPEPQPLLSGSYVGKRILLAEDNALNREIALEFLLNTGAAVDTAENGRKAVDMVAGSEAGAYDLIFMDMQMPVMDGCTAAMEIRALPREDVKRLPIIAMTANAFADDRKKTRDAGMDGHLAKPVDMKQLRQVLHQWLNN